MLAAIVLLSGDPSGTGPRSTLVAASETRSDADIVHVLNRITFGPRPGDVARVREIGLEAYLEQQLHPERIDDTALEQTLTRFETLDLDTSTLVREYHLPALMTRRRLRAEAARAPQRDGASDLIPGRPEPGMDPDELRRRRSELPPEMRRGQLISQELMEQKIIRAVSSERQLQEVLVDFWFNHFNVSMRKGPLIQPFLTEYERDVVRPHVLGRFRDLLGAVAESPAMLLYLDNWLSSDPDAPEALTRSFRNQRPTGRSRADGRDGSQIPRVGSGDPRRGARMGGIPPIQPGQRDGVNENYARELLELHTLGVDGGYTQHDVVEVARALTGWTIAPLRGGGGFHFEQRLHDDGEKHILGQTISGHGKASGDEVLDLLARHPSTARFIATKLVSRFVTDDPPPVLVERAAAHFLETDGDLREVTRLILTSPEFFATETQRAKVKTPLEFVVSSVRALDAEVNQGLGLVRGLRELGMPLYRCQPPTGYSDRADAWVNTGALLARMNFAIALVGNRLPGVQVELPHTERVDGASVRSVLEDTALDHASEATHDTIARAPSPQAVAILTLGSPEFQRQ
jgi:uncharacterized protein (DUF1800 family)